VGESFRQTTYDIHRSAFEAELDDQETDHE
jgi:hypothetical protein